ncbi:MAG TPA: prephenate dehydrogenase [Chthoniobacteraceae bacterium]|jgi:prephenate dehydrogenase|nr:prephenate dehydrogenase [Chthoniobacteraceae bacterium]
MKLAVFGPGLLGSSIALAARRRGDFRVAIWGRREEAVAELRAREIGDLASTDLAAVARDADLAVLCVPIGAMPALARQLAQMLPRTALVTDVGSVKAPVVHDLGAIFRGNARFVGSHPMAGSEQQGLHAARADLFEQHVCIVTPDAQSEPEAVAEISSFWERLGCLVRRLPPEEHDEIAAAISHVPHLLAAALVNAVAGANPDAFAFAGPGFRDTTRVASGPPEMWTEILGVNRRAVKKSAEAMIEKLREFLTLLDSPAAGGDATMNQFLTSAKAQRDRLRVRA